MDFLEDNMVILLEAMRNVYGADDYEWNHYKLPAGEIYEFPKVKNYLLRSFKVSICPWKTTLLLKVFYLCLKIT